jgi:hypothetical protein
VIGMKVDKVRLNLQLSRELYAELEEMADKSATTTSDVMRRALALLKAAQAGRSTGKHLGLAEDPDMLDQEIVGF